MLILSLFFLFIFLFRLTNSLKIAKLSISAAMPMNSLNFQNKYEILFLLAFNLAARGGVKAWYKAETGPDRRRYFICACDNARGLVKEEYYLDNSPLIHFSSPLNLCCWYTLEASQRGASNKYRQRRALGRNKIANIQELSEQYSS